MAMMDHMSALEIANWAKLALNLPNKYVWSNYDSEADVLYINFKKPAVATDSELTDDDIIIRYEGDEIIGFTPLHACKHARELND